MSTLFMIRHGQASFGQENYDRLSELGNAQAKRLGEYFRDLGIAFDAFYTGTMQRHLETAEQFFLGFTGENTPGPSLNAMEAFNEYDPEAVLKVVIPVIMAEDPGFSEKVENMFADRKSFQIVFEKAILRWVSGDIQVPGLISWQDYAGGVKQGIGEVMKAHGKGKTVAVFTSGGPISSTIQKALSLSNTAAIQVGWQIINSSISRFKFTHDRIMMMSFNEHAHLEMEQTRKWITYR